MSNKNLIYFFIIALIFAVTSFFGPEYIKKSHSEDKIKEAATSKNSTKVDIQKLADLKTQTEILKYPAILKNEENVKIFAETNGNASQVNFELGEEVNSGDLLAKIDDLGSNAETSGSGIKSNSVVQSELLIKQAEESLELAEKTYENLKESSKKDLKILKISKRKAENKKDKDEIETAKNQLKSAEEKNQTALSAAKTQIELAKIQYRNAVLSSNSLEDLHYIKSPFSGVVTKKSVSKGETVSTGQLLFEISDLGKSKLQFFVNENEVLKIREGNNVTILDQDQKTLKGVISAVSPVADSSTRRFLVEAKPLEKMFSPTETILSVILEIESSAQESDSYLVPLSFLTISQNENFIFIFKDGKALKKTVLIRSIIGEKAEIIFKAEPEDQIITEGSKLISDGEEVEINQ